MSLPFLGIGHHSIMVRMEGFEPPTPRSQTECADQTALHPHKAGYARSERSRESLHVTCLTKTGDADGNRTRVPMIESHGREASTLYAASW